MSLTVQLRRADEMIPVDLSRLHILTATLRRLVRRSLRFPASLIYVWVLVIMIAATVPKTGQTVAVSNPVVSEDSKKNSTVSTEFSTPAVTPPEPVDPPPVSAPITLGLPATQTGFKSWMPKYSLTDRTSPEYALKSHYTTDDQGLCRVGDFYCVAVGAFYSTTVGDTFDITLSGGRTFSIIVADLKANRDTDANHQYTRSNGCMTEFVVNTSSSAWKKNRARITGDISSDGFQGMITAIVKTGHYDF